MSRGFLFKTILVYELLAFAIWNILMRTEADFEYWAYHNIHEVIYIILSTTLLVVTVVYVIQWSLDKLGIRKAMSEIKDPRKDVTPKQ